MTSTPRVAPVFVTADGSSRRPVRWFGRLVASLLVLWIAAVIAGGTGFATLPPLSAHLALHVPAPLSRLAAHGTPQHVRFAADRSGRSRTPGAHVRAATLRLQQRTARASAGRI